MRLWKGRMGDLRKMRIDCLKKKEELHCFDGMTAA